MGKFRGRAHGVAPPEVTTPSAAHGDRHAQACDGLNIGLYPFPRSLPLVHRQGLQEAPPGLGLQHVLHQARLTRARYTGDHGELSLGDIDADVLKVVGRRAANADGVADRNRRTYRPVRFDQRLVAQRLCRGRACDL